MTRTLKAITRVLNGASGFTLVEVMVSVGIITLVATLAGAGIFQVTAIQRWWMVDVVAAKELRHATSWLTTDALKAQNVLDGGGGVLACTPPSDTVTLVFTDSNGSHSATYRLSGADLVRELDGGEQFIITDVVADSLKFTLCGTVLTFDVEVEADRDTTDSTSLRIMVRKLAP